MIGAFLLAWILVALGAPWWVWVLWGVGVISDAVALLKKKVSDA